MKEHYDSIKCEFCGNHVCYMIDCGPRGTIICDSCYDQQPEQVEE